MTDDITAANKALASGDHIMKHYAKLTSLLLLMVINFTYGQSSWSDETFYKNCKKGEAIWDTIYFNNNTIKYSFIEKSYEHTDQNGQHNFSGTVLINLDNQKRDSVFVFNLLSAISDKVKLDKFIAFKTCEAHRLYISAMGPRNQKQKDYLRQNFVGYYDKSRVRK